MPIELTITSQDLITNLGFVLSACDSKIKTLWTRWTFLKVESTSISLFATDMVQICAIKHFLNLNVKSTGMVGFDPILLMPFLCTFPTDSKVKLVEVGSNLIISCGRSRFKVTLCIEQDKVKVDQTLLDITSLPTGRVWKTNKTEFLGILRNLNWSLAVNTDLTGLGSYSVALQEKEMTWVTTNRISLSCNTKDLVTDSSPKRHVKLTDELYKSLSKNPNLDDWTVVFSDKYIHVQTSTSTYRLNYITGSDITAMAKVFKDKFIKLPFFSVNPEELAKAIETCSIFPVKDNQIALSIKENELELHGVSIVGSNWEARDNIPCTYKGLDITCKLNPKNILPILKLIDNTYECRISTILPAFICFSNRDNFYVTQLYM